MKIVQRKLLLLVQRKYRKCKFRTVKTKNGRTMSFLKCVVCGSKKSRFMKEPKGVINSLGLKTPIREFHY